MSLPEPPPHHPCLPGGLCPRGAPGPRAHLSRLSHTRSRGANVLCRGHRVPSSMPRSRQLISPPTIIRRAGRARRVAWVRVSCGRALCTRTREPSCGEPFLSPCPVRCCTSCALLCRGDSCRHPSVLPPSHACVPPALCSAIPYREPPRPLAALLPCLRVGRGASGRCPALCCPCPSLRLATRLLANIATLRLRAQPSSALPCVSEPGGPPPPGAMQERATLSKRRSISGAQRVKPLDQKL